MDASYENMTPEKLKAEILEILKGTMETREGSYANTLMSPVAYQLYKIYQLMPQILLMAFPDNTAGEYIDRRCADFGIVRTKGTRACPCLLPLGRKHSYGRQSVTAPEHVSVN